MVKRIRGIKDKLGEEAVDEILNKEWKTAELPSEEELSKQEPANPKARNNINSRKNLIQYRKDKPVEVKEKIVSNLSFKEVEEDIDPRTILDPKIDVELLEKLMPSGDILVSRKEQEMHWNTLNLYLKDFEMDELTAFDFDDVIMLSLNKVFLHRLMAVSSKNPKMLLDISNANEKLRKDMEKIKESLAARRVDRVDVKNKGGKSIVDFAVVLDQQKLQAYEDRIKKLQEEDSEYDYKTRE